ncbi:MAG: PIN domain-containing protein [Myxococcota bacterium]|nr:PIN domain-containing protein [Deltaproteobacteria bacterium]MDQ3336819.1 PIN domain-containing protein [Myxococcota bacterium]
MTAVVLVDAGPLVALIDRTQRHHAWVSETIKRFRNPLVSCDGAIAEATHLLGPGKAGCRALMDMLERGTVTSVFELQPHVRRVSELMRRYQDVPMSFAAACLVRMTELHADVLVWTLDSDFRVYRRHGRQAIPTLMPD